ncbi:PTS system, cellobiose-specific IIA component [Pelagirhabdus alkalitolerans]|uniref:PTS system, cellobiose-specific IIA component n=2 Tax=Pelagirhabdus alkalitolerans TaxID=1612202 RepID=A0A1G6KKH8_9BACI|nr:PTS system, cellobiose-specific IIA component [Pelagirhabdus alkalitolerans]
MGIIMHGGNARSAAMKAMTEAKRGNMKQAQQLIEESNEALTNAHKIQTDLIQRETKGEGSDVSLLMVHAQDHLMNAMTVRDLALEVIHLNEKINQLEGEN